MLTKISFIGVDAKTDLSELEPIMYYGHEFGIDIEFGVLYSKSNSSNRYQLPDIQKFINETTKAGVTPSIHLCGSEAIQEFLNKDFRSVEGFNKVQLNINFNKFDNVDVIREAVLSFLDDDLDNIIIFQQNNKTIPFLKDILAGMDDEQIRRQIVLLFDSSGGNGKNLNLDLLDDAVPSYNERQQQRFITGYAGNISDKTVNDVLDHIQEKVLTNHPEHVYYIDMESGIRDEHDWLSMDKCWKVVAKVIER